MKKRANRKKPAKAKTAAKAKPSKAPKRATTYTPTPIRGLGWAPFRYPVS